MQVQNPMMSQASFESNVATIHEQWRFIKEIHPELGSLLYTLEKRLEIDNRLSSVHVYVCGF